MVKNQLIEIQDWAQERLRSGTEPPWNYYRLMQLIDAIENLDTGPIAAFTMDRLQQSESHTGTDHQPEGDVVRLDNVRRHRDAEPQTLAHIYNME